MKQLLFKPFAMLLCLVMASFTVAAQAQTRGGGDEGILVEYQISSESQFLNTGLSHVWSYPVEIQGNPSWVNFDPNDASSETLRLRITENTTNSPREARFTLVVYHPADFEGHPGTTTGRTVYVAHIVQDALL